jgi:hypothetical protein
MVTASCGASRPVGEPAAWRGPIERADALLERGNGPGAAQAWEMARVAALRSRRWEALVETGDAALRIAAVSADSAPLTRARELYLAALFRARVEGSLDGLLRVAEAFSGLGEGEVVEQCLLVAERLARGPEERGQVAAERERLGRPAATAERLAGPIEAGEIRQ